jgi:hypothetical protein
VNGRQLSADYTTHDRVIVLARRTDWPRHSPHTVLRFRKSLSCESALTPHREPHGKDRVPGTLMTMKILIALAAVGIIAGIVYKVLTTEIPIDES